MGVMSRVFGFGVVVLVAVMGMVWGHDFNITSPQITDWGLWGRMEYCPYGRYAQGFQVKTERNQFAGDDTSLNAIRLFCGDPNQPETPVVTSIQGQFGKWGSVFTCFPGELNGFQLRSESYRGGKGDDTAANNIRFFCSTLDKSAGAYIQGDGKGWGEWTEAQRCHGGQAIYGIQTQVEPYMADDGDDTMLNNVRFQCCDRLVPIPAQVIDCLDPEEKVLTVADLNIFPATKVIKASVFHPALAVRRADEPIKDDSQEEEDKD